MDSKTSLHKQLAAHFTKISLVFLLSVFLLLYLIYARETELQTVNSAAVPALQQQAKLHHLTWQSMVLFQQLTNSSNATEFTDKHQQLLSLLAQIKQITPVGKRQFSLIVDRFDTLSVNAKALTNHAEINELLHKTALIQLQLVRDQLEQEIANKQPALDKLSEQITEDKVSDSVTVSRAKARLNLANDIGLLTKTQEQVIELQVLFQRLSIRSSLPDFNHLTNNFSQLLTLWQPALDEFSRIEGSNNKLLLVIHELQQLLFGEQNVVAKWRGHIRVAQQYLEQVNVERQNALTILQRVKLPKVSQTEFPGYLANILAPYTTYQYRTFLLAILIVIGVLYLILILQIRSSKRRLKHYEDNLLSVVERSVLGEKVIKEQLSTRSLVTVHEEISQLNKPIHNEQDYQQLQAKLNRRQMFCLTHLDAIYLEVTSVQSKIPSELRALLSEGSDKQYNTWHDVFSREKIYVLLHTAKQSKHQHVTQQCIVENNWQASFSFTIRYDNGLWNILVQNRHAYTALQHSLEQSIQDANLAIDTLKKQHVRQLTELQLAITRALLTTQNSVKSYEEHYNQLYRRLQETVIWCQQALFIGSGNEEHEYSADINFINFAHSVANNIALEQKAKSNRILLTVSQNIAHQVTLTQPYASDCLLAIGKLVLQDQISAALFLSIALKDVNPGQQVLTVRYQVKQATTNASVPGLVTLLAKQGSSLDAPLVIQYIHALCYKLHINELRIEPQENGFDLSFEFPLAIASNTEQNVEAFSFSQQHLYLVTADRYLKQFISESIQACDGKLEVFSTAKQVKETLHLTHLKKHTDAVLLITPEIAQKDIDAITNHFSGLPDKVIPKLFYIQGFNGSQLTRNGLCSVSDNALSNIQLQQSLLALTKEGELTNRMLMQAELSQYHYRTTKVQVLLASSNIVNLAPLITLLQWAGVKVKTVCEVTQAISYWQSGRYSVLLTDFSQSPYVELSAGKKLTRGVFQLGKNTFSVAQPTMFQHWQVGQFACIHDVDALLTQLAPWLSPLPPLELIETSSKSLKKAAPVSRQRLAIQGSARQEASLKPAFDLTTYTENQGSPELAVYMLDDYLQDISQAISTINTALNTEHKAELNESISLLINRSKIVAAHELLLSAQALKEVITKGNKAEINNSFDAVKKQQQLLYEFCQAI